MTAYNYTKVAKREKRTYSLFDLRISRNGLTTSTIQSCLIFLAIFTIFGLIFCAVTGTLWYNPLLFVRGPQVAYFYLIFIGTPLALGIGLNSYKIQEYRATDYIKIYCTPKKPLNQHGRRIKIQGYQMDGFVERI